MADNEIKITIGGDVEGLKKAASGAGNAIDGMGKKITASVGKATGALDKNAQASRDAMFAITNLSRVAQDAPFGFIGIANNLNPLFESFQRLQVSAGGTRGALRALLSSIGGAGGIGLVVGLGSAALTLLSQGFFSSGKAAKEASKEIEEFKNTLQEAAGDAAREAVRVTTLFNALSSGTLNVEERKAALKELKSINRDYFGSLKEEEGIIKGLQQAYQNYLDKIIQIGRAKAIEKELTKLFDEKLQLELSIDPRFLTQTNPVIQRVIGSMRKDLQRLGGEVTNEGREMANIFGQQNEQLRKRIGLQQSIATLERGLPVIQDEHTKKIREQIRLVDLRIAGLTELQKSAGEFNIQTTENNKKEEDALKKRLSALERIRDLTKDINTLTDLEEQIFDLKVKITLRDAAKNGLSKEEVDLMINGLRKQLGEAFLRQALAYEVSPRVKFSRVELAPFPSSEVNSAVAKATGLDKEIKLTERDLKIKLLGIEFVEAEEQAKKAAEQLRNAILNGITEAIATTSSAFGELLGSIFSGKGIGDEMVKAAEALLAGIGGVLQEIGKQIIATSTLIKSLQTALKSLITNPVAGIAVGVGLIALGGLLKSIKIPGFAEGVQNFSGGLAIVGERGPELVNLPRGSDVIPNHLLGGNMQVVLQPSIRFSGDGFQIMLERVNNRRQRLG